MSGGHLKGVVAPQVMGIGPGMAIGVGGKLIAAGAARNLCACMGDLNLPISFSRLRVGRCDPSMRLFKPLCAR